MSNSITIVFAELCINMHLLPFGDINECRIRRLRGRHLLTFNLTQRDVLELDIRDCISEFQCSKWVSEPGVEHFFDFNISLDSIPAWMMPYSTATLGFAHRILATIRIEDGKARYLNFLEDLLTSISITQFTYLETDKALSLWKKRCTPISNRIVDGVKFLPSQFGRFRQLDLERLKDDNKWLSDAHITFALRDCFRDCLDRSIWGDLIIKLLDTRFWELLSSKPKEYRAGQRRKENLLECDFAVMPMFGDNHWRLGIVEKPREFMQGNTILHILDSLRYSDRGTKEANQLQNILLQYFDGGKFKAGRISINVPQVPQQNNSKDCACYTIYFARKFLLNPKATMPVIKQNPPSAAEGLAQWGLNSNDLTFVRRDLRILLFKYISQGEAVVELT